jgi:hypothetical protein
MIRLKSSMMLGSMLLVGGIALGQTTSTSTATTAAAPSAPRRAASPSGTAATQVGDKWIEIVYSRPILRGRADIFGKGADYGKTVNAGAPVWRAGANVTTKLTTEVPLMIGGKRIEPGTYDVFVDLKEGGWTLILSKQPTQDKYDPNDKTKIWGSYGYDPKYDVVRVPMTPVTPAVSVDQFTIAFADMTDAGGKLAMVWEKTGAVVPFTVAR